KIECLNGNGIAALKRCRGDVLRGEEGRVLAIGCCDGVVKIDDAASAKDLFGRNSAFDLVHMFEDFCFPFGTGSQIHMPALARYGYPGAFGMQQGGDTKTGAGTKHNTASNRSSHATADSFKMLLAKGYHRKRLCFEVV